MERIVLGIDVGKRDFHCSLLERGKKPQANSFPNSQIGFEQLSKWLSNRGALHLHTCIEATGGWSEDLALHLHDSGHRVSIVNPAAIKAFGRSELSRTKTDKADAALIARYCMAMVPAAWQPPSRAQQRIRSLVRRRSAVDAMRVQEHNRLGAPGVADVRESIEQTIAFLSQQISRIDAEIQQLVDDDPDLRRNRELLETIPGVGPRVSTTVLSEVPRVEQFRSARALAAYAGLCPHQHRSGSSVSASWLSKAGNANLRRVLYLPAIVAMRYNPTLKLFAKRLKERGKRPKQIIAAVMRRLLVLIYGVLKTQHAFSLSYAA